MIGQCAIFKGLYKEGTNNNAQILRNNFCLEVKHLFKVHTPTGFEPSVSGGSVCLSVSDPE